MAKLIPLAGAGPNQNVQTEARTQPLDSGEVAPPPGAETAKPANRVWQQVDHRPIKTVDASIRPTASPKDIAISQAQAKLFAAGFRSNPNEKALAEHLVASVVSADPSLPPLQEAIEQWMSLAGDYKTLSAEIRSALAHKQLELTARTAAALAPPKMARAARSIGSRLPDDPPSAMPELKAEAAKLRADYQALPSVKQLTARLAEVGRSEFPEIELTGELAVDHHRLLAATRTLPPERQATVKQKLDSLNEYARRLHDDPAVPEINGRLQVLAARIEKVTSKMADQSLRDELGSPQGLRELGKILAMNERAASEELGVTTRILHEHPELSQEGVFKRLAPELTEAADPQAAFERLPAEKQAEIIDAVTQGEQRLTELVQTDPALANANASLTPDQQALVDRTTRLGEERTARLLPIAIEQSRLSAIAERAAAAPVETLLTSGEVGLARLFEAEGLTPKGKAGDAISLPSPSFGSGAPMTVVAPPPGLESTPEMVRQGGTGVCYLASSVAVLAKDKDFFRKVMRANADGSFTFRFFREDPTTKAPEPFDVTVPGRVYSGASAVISQTTNKDGTVTPEDPRFALLEVAYAKAFGRNSAEQIEGGSPAIALYRLTGKKSTTIYFSPPNGIELNTDQEVLAYYKSTMPGVPEKTIREMMARDLVELTALAKSQEVLAFNAPGKTDPERQTALANEQWRILREAEARGAQVIASTAALKNPESTFLEPIHAYAVSGTFESEISRLVVLRNPHGETIYVPIEKLSPNLGDLAVLGGIGASNPTTFERIDKFEFE